MNAHTEAKLDYLQYVSETTDTKAILRDLMETYGDDVWNFAFSMCRRPDLAHDITQDVFLKAYRSWTSFRGESSVKTWLLSITRNAYIDYRRSAFFRKVTLVDFISSKGSGPSAENEALDNIAISEIWSYVFKLPAKYREVLVLYARHQMSMQEIARMLGVSEGTVKSRLHHARKKVLCMKESDIDEA